MSSLSLFAALGDAEVRFWTSMSPALVFSAYFLIGLLVYALRYAVRGAYRDPEMEARQPTPFANMWIRLYFAWLMQPLWRLLLRTGLPPLAVTTLSALLALGSGISLAAGRFALGGWLYIFAGICDVLDGRLARARNQTSPGGAVLDSILDRYSDAAVLCGLAWYYRTSYVLLLVLFALVGASLVPYIRARGEAAGVAVKIGMMQRAERILYLGVACALSPVVEVLLDPRQARPIFRLTLAGLALLAVVSHVTALQRLFFLLARLRGESQPASVARSGSPAAGVLAAGVATALDVLLVLWLVTGAGFAPALATAIGALLGGILGFLFNRMPAVARAGYALPQARRYLFLTLTNAGLNAGGVALLLLLPGIDYRIAWLLARVAVFVTWSWPLHRDYLVPSQPLAATVDSARR